MSQLTALRDGLAQLHRETGWSELVTDEFASELSYRVTAIEEVLAARWPRSILVRARFRRDVRASVRHISGGSFGERRVEAVASGWVTRPGSRWALPESGRRDGRWPG